MSLLPTIQDEDNVEIFDEEDDGDDDLMLGPASDEEEEDEAEAEEEQQEVNGESLPKVPPPSFLLSPLGGSNRSRRRILRFNL
jgi:hypothetical protein